VELSDVTQQALGAALRGAQARHQALAGNIANATTPGYVRQDADFHNTLRAALGTGQSPRETVFAPTRDPAAGPVRADGGTIDPLTARERIRANGPTIRIRRPD